MRIAAARLYTRPGCHLCDKAAAILERLAAEGLLQWESVNIEDDPALLARFAAQIPVVEIDGGPLFAGRISEYRLRRALTAPNEDR